MQDIIQIMDGRKFSTKNIKSLANNSFKHEDINDCISYIIEKYCSHGDRLTETNKICLEFSDLDISGCYFKEKTASMEMSALESEATKHVANSSQEIDLDGRVSEIYELIKESKMESCVLEENSEAEEGNKTLHIRNVNPMQSVLGNTYNRNKRHTQMKGSKKRSRKTLSYVQKREGIANYKRMENTKLKCYRPFLSSVQKKQVVTDYGTKTTKENIQTHASTVCLVQKNQDNSNNAENEIEEIELNRSFFEQNKQDFITYGAQRVEEEIKSYSSTVNSEQDRQCISNCAEKAKETDIELNDSIYELEPNRNVSNSEAETFEELTSYTKVVSSEQNGQDISNYGKKATETESELNEIISLSEENEPGVTNCRTEAMEEEVTCFSPTVSFKQNIESISKYGDTSMEEDIQLDTALSSEQEKQNVTNCETKAMEKRMESYSATAGFESNRLVSPNYESESVQVTKLNNSLLSPEQKKQSITNYLTNALEEEIESCSSTVSSVQVIQTPEIPKTRKLKSTIGQLPKRKRTNNPFEKEEIVYKKNKPSYNRNKYDKFRNASYSVVRKKQPVDSRKKYSSSISPYNSCDRNARGGVSYSTKLSAVKNRDTISHTYSRAESTAEPEDIGEEVTGSILSFNSPYLISRDELAKLYGAPNKYKFRSYPSTVTTKRRKEGDFSSMLSCNSNYLYARDEHPSLTKSADEQDESDSVVTFPFDETTIESEYMRQEDDNSVMSSNSSFFDDRNAVFSPKSPFFNKILQNTDGSRESNCEEVSLDSNDTRSPNDSILQEDTARQKYENFHVTVSLQASSSNHKDNSGNCIKIVPNTSRHFLFKIQEPATETIGNANAFGNVSFHIIKWKTVWLKTQKKTNTFPWIYKLKPVKHRYRSFKEYVDTYYGLYLMSIWINIYDSWMNPTTLFYANLVFYIEKEYYFENICNALLPIADIPKCHGVILLTCRTVQGGEQCMFGYVHNIQVENALAPLHRLGIWKQVKITFYTSEKIMIRRNSSLKMQQLCNVRDQYKQFQALQSFRSSMREVIVDPQYFEQKIEIVTIPPMCSPGQLQQHVNKILDCALSPDNRFTLVLEPAYSDSVLTILELIRNMTKRSTLLVCLRNADKCLNVAEVLKNLKTDFLLAVKLTEVYVPRALSKYLLCHYALDLDERRHKADTSEVLKKSEVILTVLPFSCLSDCRKTVFGSNLTCIIDDAHFYTEVETALPLSYEPKNMILLGNSKCSLKLHPFLQSCGYQVSLFHRLFEGKKIL